MTMMSMMMMMTTMMVMMNLKYILYQPTQAKTQSTQLHREPSPTWATKKPLMFQSNPHNGLL